ncbi:Asp23/Gls24 family envelope stress response protein [Actinoplanes couchii]|uniref:Asp23/Gls24 family envelope stress response protein n=1 Tax=Actinoplanes couchii TaxID=403638 RepID=A0ABQ3XB66_9ACTN|nr:Asp23/Gls24 family envelope stress response protein [Actinoplanes couchii]MDR6323252.1 putative alkaline shock family protein YloU [Actinoplanes couchii]GID55766.1 hypothetical protein Aco03nite_041700 [Actinoplanes couchii]
MSEAVDGTVPTGTTPTSTTTVSAEVVEKITVAAAKAVPGVAELGGDVARFFNTVLDRVGLDSVGDGSRGVSATVAGNDVTVTVVLVLEAGRVVAEVTAEVQVKVTEALTGYGLNVLAVHVKVDDIAGV